MRVESGEAGAINNRWQILIPVALLLFAGLVILHRDELAGVLSVLKEGRWAYFLAALGLQMIFFAFQAFMYRELLGIWKVSLDFTKVYLITLASSAGNKLIPSGGASGLAVFIGEARRDGVDAEVSLLTNAWFYLLDYLAFLLVVIWGAAYLFRSGGLTHTEELAVIVFTVIILAALSFFVLALKSTGMIINFLENRFRPRSHLIIRAKNIVIESLARSRITEKDRPRAGGRVAAAFLGGVGMQITDIAILIIAFKVVNYSVDTGMVVAGFGLASILSLVSMVPQGIGIYETSMTWLYTQMGVPFSIALTVALLYRGATFWFPVIPGIISIRLAGRTKA